MEAVKPFTTLRAKIDSAAGSVGCGWSRSRPGLDVGAAPCNRARAQANRSRKVAIGDEAVDGRSAQARGADDRADAQQHGRFRGVDGCWDCRGCRRSHGHYPGQDGCNLGAGERRTAMDRPRNHARTVIETVGHAHADHDVHGHPVVRCLRPRLRRTGLWCCAPSRLPSSRPCRATIPDAIAPGRRRRRSHAWVRGGWGRAWLLFVPRYHVVLGVKGGAIACDRWRPAVVWGPLTPALRRGAPVPGNPARIRPEFTMSSSSSSPSSESLALSSLMVCDATGAYRPASADEVLRQARLVLSRRVRRGVAFESPAMVKDVGAD